jgi:hypothetical protein
MRRSLLRGAALAAALALALPGAARAQTPAFPTRPVTVIIPFAAGGPTDVVGRTPRGRHGARPRPARRGGERDRGPAAPSARRA